MKNKISILQFLLFILIPYFIQAQKSIDILHLPVNMSKGSQPAYQVSIPETNLETVKKEWMKLIRQNTKSKVEEMGQELIIKGTLIKEIYPEPINIYSALVGGDSAIKVIAVFEIDSLIFTLDESNKTVQNEKTHNAIKKFMRDFAVGQYSSIVQEQVDAEVKKLGALNKELEDLTKQIESDRKEVKSNEQDIKNSQDAIASYEKENERKMGEIDSKKEANAAVKNDPELRKAAKEQLKSLEKEKSSIENNLEKEQKNIVKYQSKIDELNRSIDNNLTLVEEKKTEITTQEAGIKQVTAKLNGIK